MVNETANRNVPAITVTSNMHVAKLESASLNLYVTVVVPTVKKVPGSCDLRIRFATLDRSVAVGSTQLTIVPPVPNSVILLKLVGQLSIVGGVVSSAN